MNKNYTQRLEKLKKRRLDENLEKAILSRSFSDITIGESVKYALEAMSEIDRAYTNNTYLASENIQGNLISGLKKSNLTVEFRHQGSIQTNTHIKVHSDIDILVFTDKYISLDPPLTPAFPYQGDPLADLKELRQKCFEILNSTYNQVDNTKPKSIQVFPTKPKRKVDVVVCSWLDTPDYERTQAEIYRGVRVYNKEEHSRSKDYPFLHIARVNEKDNYVGGGLRKLVRLLKTLKADADYEINLSSFEITSCIYSMENQALTKPTHQQQLLLKEASSHLAKLIDNKSYRESLMSPNGKEVVFGSSESKLVELKKLKLELDELIQDINEELANQYKRIDQNIIYA